MGSSASSPASQQHQGQGNSRRSAVLSVGSNFSASGNNVGNSNSNPGHGTRSDGRNASRNRRGSSNRSTASSVVADSDQMNLSRLSGESDMRQQQQQRRFPPGLEALQDAQNLSSGSHLLLNRPYPISQRTETEGTAVGFGNSNSFSAPLRSELTAMGAASTRASDWELSIAKTPSGELGTDFSSTSYLNSSKSSSASNIAVHVNVSTAAGAVASNSTNGGKIPKPSQMMRRVHSSGGSSSANSVSSSANVNVNVPHNFHSSAARRVTSQSRVAGMTVITSETKHPPVYAPSSSATAAAVKGTNSGQSMNPSISNTANAISSDNQPSPVHTAACLNPASDINSRLDTQVEVKVYPCSNNGNTSGKKKFTQFTVKPEGVIIQGTNRRSDYDLGSEYARHIGRKLQRYELADTRACQLLVTSHSKSFWVVPAPEAFSRHSGTCRLLGDRKHSPTAHTLQVGDFLRVGSVGVVVIETHDGVQQKSLSEERIQKIMKDTASGGFIDVGETDGENSEASNDDSPAKTDDTSNSNEQPVCYMCFDESNDDENPLITPCKCIGDTKYVHVECLRKWHTAEADNQICFLSSVDATCSVCKSTFKSDFRLRNGKLVKLFKSSLEPPYVSLLIATKHEMAQRLFNTRFQLSFSTILKADRKNGARPLLMGRSSGSDMVLDYRTVSARHASIRFKNGEFIFSDAGSSNGSYLYLRRPVELTSSQSVQFRLGRSMISMKIVNKWNRRLLRAVRRSHSSSSHHTAATDGDDHSIGSEEEINITDELTGTTIRPTRRTRDSIMQSLPPLGFLAQTSPQHLDLLHALAYPKKNHVDVISERKKMQLKRSVGAQVNELNENAKENSSQEIVPVIQSQELGSNTNTLSSKGPNNVQDLDLEALNSANA